MHFKIGKNQIFSMSVNGEETEINQVSEQEGLGVIIIYDTLKFIPHIQAMIKKANRNNYLGIIKLR